MGATRSLFLCICFFSFIFSQVSTISFGYVTNRDDDTVSVIDLETNMVVNTITVGDNPNHIATTPDQCLVLVASDTGETVHIIDVISNTVIATVTVGSIPQGIAFTPDSHFAYVANFFSHNVSVIDLDTYTVVDTVSVGTQPRDVAILIKRKPCIRY